MESSAVRVARVYDPPGSADGSRVLVDRLWPRGLAKEAAALDDWCRTIAPSTQLRTWYMHDPARFEEFAVKYRAELADAEQSATLAGLRRLSELGTLTLLTATKALSISHAVVLAGVIAQTA
ncbi:DUF488 domain-containing protein [Jatrophihabitans sp. DSM 45814]